MQRNPSSEKNHASLDSAASLHLPPAAGRRANGPSALASYRGLSANLREPLRSLREPVRLYWSFRRALMRRSIGAGVWGTAILIYAAACGHSGASPTAPTTPASPASLGLTGTW